MNNLELKRAILQKIEEFQTIIIARHVKPDGDCIGSSLGLREILRLSFPEKRILSVGRPASSFSILSARKTRTSAKVLSRGACDCS